MTREELFSALRQDGIAGVFGLGDQEMWEVNNYLRTRLVYNAHVRAKASDSCIMYDAIGRQNWPAFSVDMSDIVTAPHVLEHVLKFYPLAKAYFEEPAYLYSMNAFWTQPAASHYRDTHDWHRDTDDRKQLVVFIYGSDILEPWDGMHFYQLGTHIRPDDKLGRSPGSPTSNMIKMVKGLAGTTFLEDTRGLHMAMRPTKGARLLIWGRFGVSKPPDSYIWDALKPVNRALLGNRYPTSSEMQEAISLVVA